MQSQGEQPDTSAADGGAQAPAFPALRVRRIADAIGSISGLKVAFLDPTGAESRFDDRGALTPVRGARPVLPSDLLLAAERDLRPILHASGGECLAVAVPIVLNKRLLGYVAATGFTFAQLDENASAELKERYLLDGGLDGMTHGPGCSEIAYDRFRAVVDLLDSAATNMALLAQAYAQAQGATPLSSAVTSTLEEIARACAAPSAVSEAVEARERLEALYDSTHDAILMLDRDLKIVAANKEFGRVFGTDANAFLGVTGEWLRRWVVKNAKEPARVSAQIEELLATPSAIVDDEIELLSPRYMTLRFYSAPVNDKWGAIIGRALVFRDITDLRKARQDVIGTEKMSAIGRAAAGLAHEINNILAGVLTYADYALEEGTNETMREALRMSVAAAEKASTLVGEFLAVSEPSESLRQDVDLHLELERLLDSLEEVFRKDNIRIHRLLEAVPRVSVDPVQMLKVFHHVLDNARQAIGKDGTVTVRTETDWDRGAIRIIITDSGPGIAPQLIDRIFDPFFTTKGVITGGDTAARGLGLSVAKGIVEAHGGRIYAGNVLPHGASFVIELPLPGALPEEPPSPSAY